MFPHITLNEIEYLRTENKVLREVVGKKRILLDDDQQRRLAVSQEIKDFVLRFARENPTWGYDNLFVCQASAPDMGRFAYDKSADGNEWSRPVQGSVSVVPGRNESGWWL